MKLRVLCMLLVLLLSVSFTACSDSKNDLSLNNSSSVSGNEIPVTSIPTGAPAPVSESKRENTSTPVPSDHNSVLDAYKAVLQNNAAFFSTDNKKKLTLNNFLTNKELYGVDFKVTRFTVLDMDGDKVSEVVLELTVDQYPEFYEVLHDMNGKVYGYNIVYRGLEQLKADGTFYYSNGAADYGFGKLKFQADTYETDVLGYVESSQNNDGITQSYFIGNDPETKESFDSFAKEQDEKKDVVWHEFSQKNVETELYKR